MGAEWFGGRLRELREAAGLTQRQLGDKAGVSWRAVAEWEAGRREPGWSNVLALAEALGVDCRTFDEKPRTAPKRPRGRPKKEQS